MTFPATFTAQVAHIQEIIKDAEQTTLLAELATLQNILSQNIDYIPSYDKKRYALQINEITNEINKLHPPVKPKFGFQMPAKKQDPQAKQVHTKNTEVQEQQSVRLEECEQGKQVKRADLPRDEIILKNLNAASIDLRGEGPEIQTLHLINLHNSIIYTAHVKSSLVIDEMSDCTVYVECQQIRIHNARNTTFVIYAYSDPIIEDSTSLTFKPLNDKSDNRYKDVRDFNWLKDSPSPHFTTMER